MINVSKAFEDAIKTRTDFIETAVITFKNGEVVELEPKDFCIKNNSVTDGASNNGLPVGVAVSRSIKIEIANYDDRFSDYDFQMAVIQLFCSLELSDKVETIDYGFFTVITPETYGDTIIITAVDDMYKLDKPYETSLQYPARLDFILQDVARQCGFLIKNEVFKNCDFEVMNKPEKLTCRQVVANCAMIAGGNARFNRYGYLEILSYDMGVLSEVADSVDGGSFRFIDGATADGGDFSYNNGDNLDGGDFGGETNHVLTAWKSLKVDTDDAVITGIQTNKSKVEEGEEKTVLVGQEGYVLNLKNDFFAGKELDALERIGRILIGLKFRTFSGDYIAYPLAEFMDLCVVVDRKGHSYKSYITDVSFSFGGLTRLKNSGLSALRNSSTAFSNATQTIIEAMKLVENEKTERQVATELLQMEIENSKGMYFSELILEDGSVIRYIHDKPSINESQIVWRFSIDTFAISNDGGQTYPYGFDISGTAIMEKIYAQKISADYIEGGVLKLGGENNVNGQIYIYNSDGEQCGVINNAGVVFYSKIQNQRIIMSPSVGFVTQASGSGDFFGYEYKEIVHCGRTQNVLAGSTYNISHGDTFKMSQYDYKQETISAVGVNVTTPYYRWKYWYEDTNPAHWVESSLSKRQYSSLMTEYELKLPDKFIGKELTITTRVIGINQNRLVEMNDNEEIQLSSSYSYLFNSYYEKADGKTWVSDWKSWDMFGTDNDTYNTANRYEGTKKTLDLPTSGIFYTPLYVINAGTAVSSYRQDDDGKIYIGCTSEVSCRKKDDVTKTVKLDIPDLFDIEVVVIC